MSALAIRAHGLSKRFRIKTHAARGMHEALERVARHPLRSLAGLGDKDFIWALRGASFEVQRGESVALLGRNGAGKSVLLKILARVTAPTEGSAEIFGHLAPLLEVGAGFHPELSGRENIFFNGALLGMNREQIRRKLDEIVAFSDIEPFIETPVKVYSTGMRMRLAFSVAVHLEPEILLIDEALAVGDADFREKCRAKIRDFIERGCTVMLVTHDLNFAGNLCTRAIVLEAGRITADGDVAAVVEKYSAARVIR